MRRPTLRPIAPLAAVAAMLLIATSAAAKEGGVAKLAAPLPRDAVPGATITVRWSVQAFTDADGGLQPFSAAGVYIRLIGLDVSEAIGTEERPGWYVADVVVPRGGISAAEFGVHGTATYPDGHTERADMPFGFDGVLLSPALPPAVPAADPPAAEPAPAGPTPAGANEWAAPVAALGLVAALVAVAAIRRARRPAAA
jgi:hypothetical protein